MWTHADVCGRTLTYADVQASVERAELAEESMRKAEERSRQAEVEQEGAEEAMRAMRSALTMTELALEVYADVC
jgi:Tfp pilus assembly protein FimV